VMVVAGSDGPLMRVPGARRLTDRLRHALRDALVVIGPDEKEDSGHEQPAGSLVDRPPR
jgi:hypothetical protein